MHYLKALAMIVLCLAFPPFIVIGLAYWIGQKMDEQTPEQVGKFGPYFAPGSESYEKRATTQRVDAVMAANDLPKMTRKQQQVARNAEWLRKHGVIK